MPAMSIIPQPQSIQPAEGTFTISDSTVIIATGDLLPLAELSAEILRPLTGCDLPVRESGDNAITLILEAGHESEAYTLTVSREGIEIKASAIAGLFYGIQTLRQLLLPGIESKGCVIPAVKIIDEPRFKWRGLHLDVARHFFGVDFIKKFIDTMALYKFNIFHWHLTEDQGWRIEIKQYPELTEIGSKRSETPIPANRNQGDGKPYGGYYTQDEIREIVAFASERSVTIVPEIEMPGHALAALASYPHLGCVGEGYQVRTRWGIEKDVFCAGKESVFEFLENVLSEVLDLFPGEFIHIGGDECPKDRWKLCPDCQSRIKVEGLKNEFELQSYFIRRIEKWLTAKGRRLVGWDEILEGGLAPDATVMSWRGSQGGIDAANAGHDVVMSPDTHCYLDHYQSKDTDSEPPAIGGYISLEKAYHFQPVPENISADKVHHILGGQGNIWTEYMPTSDQVEYMSYPRAIALAEVLWSYPEPRNFEGFSSRLNQHFPWLRQRDLNFRMPRKDD